MAIQTINLTVPGGDTPRSANTKINANFSDQTNAASRLVGKLNGRIPVYEDITSASIVQVASGLPAGVTDIDDAPVGSRIAIGGSSGGGLGKEGLITTLTPSSTEWIVTTEPADKGTLKRQIAKTNPYNSPDVTASRVYGGINRVWSNWNFQYSTRNTTKDSNGFLKAASPIVKVHADKVVLNEEAEQQNVTYKKNGVGDYTITTVSGLSTDGWYIELPKDMNGNPKVAVTLSEVDGVISLKSYKRIFSMETFTFEPDLDSPLDIPDTRWIDLRLNEIPFEMPDDTQTEV